MQRQDTLPHLIGDVGSIIIGVVRDRHCALLILAAADQIGLVAVLDHFAIGERTRGSRRLEKAVTADVHIEFACYLDRRGIFAGNTQLAIWLYHQSFLCDQGAALACSNNQTVRG